MTGLAPELLSSLGAAVVVTAAALALRALVLRRLIQNRGRNPPPKAGSSAAPRALWPGEL